MSINNWQNIWDKKNIELNCLNGLDNKATFLLLKKLNGFDIVNESIKLKEFEEQYQKTKYYLSKNNQIRSIYEVGCGSGANLFLFQNDKLEIGGNDFSSNLINIAKHILNSKDINCSEAIELETSNKYDAILSNSVFSYFKDKAYATVVLEKMYEKTNYSIGILDIHDKKQEKKFIEYRRNLIKNYDEKYKNLTKLFYSKKFFIDFAKQNNMDIEFVKFNMPGYWNNDFIFNCFLYKKEVKL